jgi:hypothetical protein
MLTREAVFAALIALGALAGCGGDDDDGDVPAGPAAGPAFLVSTRVFGSEDNAPATSYVQVVPSLGAGSTLDVARSLEFRGAVKIFSAPSIDWFAIGDGEAPVITRYALGEGGALVAGASVSLMQLGVPKLFSESLYVVSPTKAYVPDGQSGQLVILNPAEMRIEGTIALPQTLRPGHTAIYSYRPVERAGKVLFSVGWFDWENDTVLPETGLVVVDTATDAVRYDVDARCGGITQPYVASTGEAYFVSSAMASAAFKLGRVPTKPCALRVAPGADAFAAGDALLLESLTSGALAGDPVPAGADALYLRVLDDGLAAIDAETATWKLTGQAAWSWWRWDLTTNAAAPVAALPPSPSNVSWYEVDGRVFAMETDAAFSQTTLIELTAAGGPAPALSSPGFFQGVAKLR